MDETNQIVGHRPLLVHPEAHSVVAMNINKRQPLLERDTYVYSREPVAHSENLLCVDSDISGLTLGSARGF